MKAHYSNGLFFRKTLNAKYLLLLFLTVSCFLFSNNSEAQDKIEISTPMSPPVWALLEREVLDAGSKAACEFYNHFFDERGYLLHVARWGALDGTDDAIENFKNWTIFHALGGSEKILELYKQGLEGTYRQYSEVTTSSTDVAEFGVT